MSSTFDKTFKQAVSPSPERLLAGVALAAAGSGMNGKVCSFLLLSLARISIGLKRSNRCYANPGKKQHREPTTCSQRTWNSMLGLVDVDNWPESGVKFLLLHCAPFPIPHTLQMSKRTKSFQHSC
jgi:hypothetical protein